jgi:hypothetical protein
MPLGLMAQIATALTWAARANHGPRRQHARCSLQPTPPRSGRSKLGYGALLVCAAGSLAARLALPLSHVRAPAWSLAVITAGMALLGLAALFTAAPSERGAALLGSSWYRCPLIIPAVALPALAAALWTLRGMAPTRLRAAGFAVGLLAGALGTIGYSLHCPEESLTFVAIWYSLGILASGGLGALLGPRALRW